jgi:hypothetical protein
MGAGSASRSWIRVRAAVPRLPCAAAGEPPDGSNSSPDPGRVTVWLSLRTSVGMVLSFASAAEKSGVVYAQTRYDRSRSCLCDS